MATAGSYSGGTAVTVDPDPCNAIQSGPGGLTVPGTVITAGPGVEVTPPDPGACPQTWQVGIDPGSVPPPAAPHGMAVLESILQLAIVDPNIWYDAQLEVTLPEAGTYQIDATVHAHLMTGSPAESYITARLRDVTAEAVVPHSNVMVVRLSPPDAAGAVGNSKLTTSAPIQIEYTVPGPTTIRLQAMRTIVSGSSAQASIQSSDTGYTTLRYRKIA